MHTAAAREPGATKEEIAEVLGVVASVNAGATVVYSTRALDEFDALPKSNLTPESMMLSRPNAEWNTQLLSDGLKSTYPSAVILLADLEAISASL